MKFNELVTIKTKNSRRVGRGIAAGRGKTAGRGTKGQKSRTGSGRKPGFEGGQNPLMQRMPKVRGFKSKRIKMENVFVGQLENLGPKIDNFTLYDAGLVSSPYTKVKLLSKGILSKKITVKLQGASIKAVEAIQKVGGSFEVTDQVKRQKLDKNTEK